METEPAPADLSPVEQVAIEAEQRAAVQRDRIKRLAGEGQDTSEAEAILHTMVVTLKQLRQRRDKLNRDRARFRTR